MHLSLWAAIRARQRGHDDGFTVIELMAALIVIFIAMAALAGAIVTSVTSISMGKERQTAALLLNRAMEQARAMPFETLAAGIPNTDTTLATDANLTQTGTVNGHAVYSYGGETLRTYQPYSTPAALAPLNPHVTSTTLNKSTYKVSTYPTVLSSNQTVVHLTIVVTWTSIAQHGLAKQITGQTLVYSPSGCLSNGTHPFAAPCQPYFYANGTTGQNASIQITPLSSGSAGITGVSFSQALLELPVVDMDMQLEQIDRILGQVTSSGAEMMNGSTSSLGLAQVTSQTDDDPTTSYALTQSSALGSYSVSPALQIGGSSGSNLVLTPSGGDLGNTLSTVSAANTTSCLDLSGIAQSNASPCAYGYQEAQGTSTANLDLFAGSTNLGAAPLASIAAPGAYSKVFGTRVTGSGGTYCGSTSGDGCIHAAETRTLGTVRLGGLPPQLITDDAQPANWPANNYLVKLSGYTDTLTSESGVNAASPTTSESGTLTYCSYNANQNSCNYTSVSLGSSAKTITIPQITLSDTKVSGGTLQVSVSASFTYGGTSTSSAGTCSSGCTTTATSNAPLTGTIDYTVSWGGSTLAQLAVAVNLGGASVSTTYKQAPNG